MTKPLENFSAAAVESQKDMFAFLERLYEAASPEAVFSEPVTVDDRVVITASEVNVGLGAGYGMGGGSEQAETSEEDPSVESGIGGGGGGGGGASGRPVAVISIGKDGVVVEPILDATKVALAFFTALGSMFLMFSRMKKK